MKTIDARSGWTWVTRGFALFRQRPAELISLFFMWMMLAQLLKFIPVAGQFLSLFLYPVFSVGLIQACLQVENEQRIKPSLLFMGFKSQSRGALLGSGVFRILALLTATLLSDALADGDIAAFVKIIQTATGPIDAIALQQAFPFKGILFFILIYLPFAMAFWYSVPLMVWQRMPLMKSMFYSFFAVLHSWKAFVVYVLGLYGVMILVSPVILIFAGIDIYVAAFMFVALSFLIFVIAYCSSYPTYTDVFGKPDQETQPAA
ncbi:BPSS1780 family membrane protein [Undibacterium sp. Ji42W]|uniref:BPSS1780 family membrane protein n=1 Tax=Undibacterium sp. Ji42W TaxID=3413039 RepID=UPI003BF1D48B